MNNQLIKKEDISFWDKIKAFFKNIFNKKVPEEEVPQLKTENLVKEQAIDFKESLKFDVSKENKEKREFKELIDNVENNPSQIEKLSNNVLDKLINYYEEITTAKKAKIEKLKMSLN